MNTGDIVVIIRNAPYYKHMHEKKARRWRKNSLLKIVTIKHPFYELTALTGMGHYITSHHYVRVVTDPVELVRLSN